MVLQQWYNRGRGVNGTLIISQDNRKGGISSADIEEKIKRIIN